MFFVTAKAMFLVNKILASFFMVIAMCASTCNASEKTILLSPLPDAPLGIDAGTALAPKKSEVGVRQELRGHVLALKASAAAKLIAKAPQAHRAAILYHKDVRKEQVKYCYIYQTRLLFPYGLSTILNGLFLFLVWNSGFIVLQNKYIVSIGKIGNTGLLSFL